MITSSGQGRCYLIEMRLASVLRSIPRGNLKRVIEMGPGHSIHFGYYGSQLLQVIRCYHERAMLMAYPALRAS